MKTVKLAFLATIVTLTLQAAPAKAAQVTDADAELQTFGKDKIQTKRPVEPCIKRQNRCEAAMKRRAEGNASIFRALVDRHCVACAAPARRR